jgi:hypothetical protein
MIERTKERETMLSWLNEKQLSALEAVEHVYYDDTFFMAKHLEFVHVVKIIYIDSDNVLWERTIQAEGKLELKILF